MVDSPFGPIPQWWEVKAFSELATYMNGYPFKPEQLGTVGKPIIKIKELKAGVVDNTPRNLGFEVPQKYHISNGDLLFSWSADLDAYIWMDGEGLLNQHLFKVIPNPDVDLSFLFHALKDSMPRFRAISLGATMQHIKRSALDQVFTITAPPSVINEFSAVASTLNKHLVLLTQQNQNLRRTRDLLLPRLLSGQIDVGDVE